MTKTMSILLILLAANTMAQSNATNTSVQKVTKPSKLWSLSLSSSVETDSLVTDNVEKVYSNSTTFGASYKLPKDFKASLSLTMDKELTGYREEDFRDPSLSLSKSFGKISKYVTASAKASTKIPASETSRKTTSLQTALSTSGTFLYDAGKHVLEGLTIGYSLGVINNFHKYTMSSTGKSNTQRTFTNSLMFDYAINDNFGIYLDNTYYRNYTYKSEYNDFFSFDQSVTYSHDSGASVTLGHAIGGSALAIDGRESNVKLFDREESSYYITLAYSY